VLLSKSSKINCAAIVLVSVAASHLLGTGV
jgi:hypothetical protein